MIVFRREFIVEFDKRSDAIAHLQTFRDEIAQDFTCRIYKAKTGATARIVFEEEHKSIAAHQTKWAELGKDPTCQAWHKRWVEMTGKESAVFDYWELK